LSGRYNRYGTQGRRNTSRGSHPSANAARTRKAALLSAGAGVPAPGSGIPSTTSSGKDDRTVTSSRGAAARHPGQAG